MNLITNNVPKDILSRLPLPSNIVANPESMANFLSFLLVGDAPRGQFATVVYTASAKARVPYRDAVKTVAVNAILGFDYQKTVNSRMTKEELEADFVAQPRRWGKRLNVFLAEHEGTYYLTMNVIAVLDGPFYSMGDAIISKEDIAPHLPEVRESEQGGQEAKVIYREVTFANIHRVSAFGRVFVARLFSVKNGA